MPGFLVRYPLLTNEVIRQVRAPILLFHGDRDEEIYPASSSKLQKLLKPADRLIVLPGAGHNNITANARYQQAIVTIL